MDGLKVENPIRMDDLGVPILGNLHMAVSENPNASKCLFNGVFIGCFDGDSPTANGKMMGTQTFGCLKVYNGWSDDERLEICGIQISTKPQQTHMSSEVPPLYSIWIPHPKKIRINQNYQNTYLVYHSLSLILQYLTGWWF